jgi:hypothetical protein
MKEEWETFDASDEAFNSLETYFPYRYRAGLASCLFNIRFCLDVHLRCNEKEAVKHLEDLTCRLMILWNDYYSYPREKAECSRRGPKIARMRNSIPVLMAQYGIQETVAKSLLRGLTVDAEEEFKAERKRLERITDHGDGDLMKYIEGLENSAGGNALWDVTCRRYKEY